MGDSRLHTCTQKHLPLGKKKTTCTSSVDMVDGETVGAASLMGNILLHVQGRANPGSGKSGELIPLLHKSHGLL